MKEISFYEFAKDCIKGVEYCNSNKPDCTCDQKYKTLTINEIISNRTHGKAKTNNRKHTNK